MIEASDADLLSFLKTKATPTTATPPAISAISTPAVSPGAAVSPVVAQSPQVAQITQPLATMQTVTQAGNGALSEINSLLSNIVQLVKSGQDLGIIPRSAQRKIDALDSARQTPPPATYNDIVAEARKTPTQATQEPPKAITEAMAQAVARRVHLFLSGTFAAWKEKDASTNIEDLVGIWKQEENNLHTLLTKIVMGTPPDYNSSPVADTVTANSDATQPPKESESSATSSPNTTEASSPDDPSWVLLTDNSESPSVAAESTRKQKSRRKTGKSTATSSATAKKSRKRSLTTSDAIAGDGTESKNDPSNVTSTDNATI